MTRLFKKRKKNRVTDRDNNTLLARVRAFFKRERWIFPDDSERIAIDMAGGIDLGPLLDPDGKPAKNPPTLPGEQRIIASLGYWGTIAAKHCQKSYRRFIERVRIVDVHIRDLEIKLKDAGARRLAAIAQHTNDLARWKDLSGYYLMRKAKYWFVMGLYCLVEVYLAQYSWQLFTQSRIESAIVSLGVVIGLLLAAKKIGLTWASAEPEQQTKDRFDALVRSTWSPWAFAGVAICFISVLRALSFCETMNVSTTYAVYISMAFMAINGLVLFGTAHLSKWAHERRLVEARERVKMARKERKLAEREYKKIDEVLGRWRDRFSSGWANIFSIYESSRAEIDGQMKIAAEHIWATREGVNLAVGKLIYTSGTPIPSSYYQTRQELVEAAWPQERIPDRMRVHFGRVAVARLGQAASSTIEAAGRSRNAAFEVGE